MLSALLLLYFDRQNNSAGAIFALLLDHRWATQICRITMRIFRTFIKIALIVIALLLVVIIGTDIWVNQATGGRVFSDLNKIPANKVGLLLGTSKKLSNGQPNLFYEYRLDAAVQLFRAGKIDYILVSGDNSTRNYNEPVTIRQDLIRRGIPASRIYLDYAGFRTLDSVVRCREIFGQESFTVISQRFHNERAVFIALQKNINAVGYNAHSVDFRYGLKTRIREKFARVKMLLDLAFGTQPKFLGEKIPIP